MGRKGFGDDEVDAALGQLQATVKRMEGRLENGARLSEKIFGLADIIALPLID